MLSFEATSIEIPDQSSLDYGEGVLSFSWRDPLYGEEGLSIELDGHCSRMMPSRSGSGRFHFVELRRDLVQLEFDPMLANKLDLAEQVEIRFTIGDEQFGQLRRVIEYLNP